MRSWICDGCGARYSHETGRCAACGSSLRALVADSVDVVAVTEVLIPSTGHEDVPYWVALVEGESGRHIMKLDRRVSVGDRVPVADVWEHTVRTVGVAGTGVMGKGLTELLLAKGHRVVWYSRSIDSAIAARDKLVERLMRSMDEVQIADALRRLHATDQMDQFAECSLVIEAIIEDLAAKRDFLAQAERALLPTAILTSNTSGQPIDRMSEVLARPERFAVLHFFNPAPRMRLVEVARGPQTSDAVIADLFAFAEELGKQPIEIAARPAFVVNRVLMPLINEAVRSLEEGAARPHEIDEAVRLGLNHPMGPLALADLIGLDVVVEIMETIATETGDTTYLPRPMLIELVESGRVGRKAGEGFYAY